MKANTRKVWPASREALHVGLGEGLVTVARWLDAAFRSKEYYYYYYYYYFYYYYY